jgi:hypothetical protein
VRSRGTLARCAGASSFRGRRRRSTRLGALQTVTVCHGGLAQVMRVTARLSRHDNAQGYVRLVGPVTTGRGGPFGIFFVISKIRDDTLPFAGRCVHASSYRPHLPGVLGCHRHQWPSATPDRSRMAPRSLRGRQNLSNRYPRAA